MDRMPAYGKFSHASRGLTVADVSWSSHAFSLLAVGRKMETKSWSLQIFALLCFCSICSPEVTRVINY